MFGREGEAVTLSRQRQRPSERGLVDPPLLSRIDRVCHHGRRLPDGIGLLNGRFSCVLRLLDRDRLHEVICRRYRMRRLSQLGSLKTLRNEVASISFPWHAFLLFMNHRGSRVLVIILHFGNLMAINSKAQMSTPPSES
jgi:hypothetical protein